LLTVDSALHDAVFVTAAAASLVTQPVARGLTGGDPGHVARLSEPDRAWLRWLAGGGTVAALARSMGRGEPEMYRLLDEVYSRLGVRGRTEALLLACQRGLLQASSD
jgi:DNA-binding NarL/FixJ family response regulator